jgi:hypothetical protein
MLDLVHHGDRAAGPHDAGHLAEHEGGVLRVVENHVGEGRLHGGVLQRQRPDVALQQLDVPDAELGEVLPRHL